MNVADATSKLIQERLEGKKNLQGTEFFEAEGQATLLINTNSWPRFKKDEAYDHWITYREQMRVAALGQPEAEADAPASPHDRSPSATPRGSPRHSLVEEPPPPPPDDLVMAPPPVPRTSAPPPPEEQPEKPLKPPKPTPPPPVDPQPESPPQESRTTPRVPNRPAPVNRAPSRLQLDVSSPTPLTRTVVSSPPAPVQRVTSPLSLANSPPTSPTSDEADDLPPPPPPDDTVVWFMRKTSKGVAYYINTVTKATTYHAPKALIFSCVPDAEGRVRFLNNRDDSAPYEVPEPLREFARTSKLY